METYFASAARSSNDDLKLQVEFVSQNPVVNGLLDSVGGLLAVLNEHRQILALNKTLLSMLGVDNAQDVLGLRPGEVLQCVHAEEMPGGCGTSRFCSTCGAAIAIVTSLAQNQPVEKTCALTVNGKGKTVDLYLSVRAQPISFNGQRMLLLFLQDITKQQQWAMLERVFFHDLNNVLTGLVGASEILVERTDGQSDQLAVRIHQLAMLSAQEVKIQQCLTHMDELGYHSILSQVSLRQVFDQIRQMFQNHPVAKDKVLNLAEAATDVSFRTDMGVLMRVLGNMITNAFEAAAQGEQVRVWSKQADSSVSFYVWNERAIPANIARRIFQRNFSTKQELGRGLGTYSMKLFGEEFLGGKVEFTSSEATGTTFCFVLPI